MARGKPPGGPRSRRPRKVEGSGRGARDLTVRVKTARGRKLSSTLWLQRQLNDPYVQQAKRDGYRSRAAYKIAEIDDKHGVLRDGARVLDLGCAPGGWTQVAVERCNALAQRAGRAQGRVLGVDLKTVDAVPGATLMLLDFLGEEADAAISAQLGGPADVVLSDMAPSASGHKATDHLRIVALCEAAAAFAAETLAPGGAFVAKVLAGGAEGGLLQTLKRDFARVAHMKPPASRADSAEKFVVALGFRGRNRFSDPSG
ncbi:MAG: RlmE family RNA methyltransferase [Pseudomonadota bacterium]